MATALIPQINIAPLFAEDLPARAAVDAAIFAAAQEIGFLTITGMPAPSAIEGWGLRGEVMPSRRAA